MTPDQLLELAQHHLTQRQFEAFRLVHEQGMSQRAAAQVLGIDRSGFRHHLNRAYDRLADIPEVYDWARGSRSSTVAFEDAPAGAPS